MVGSCGKVLVVENDAMLRFALCETLTDAGFQVIDAASVLEAVGLLGCHDDIGVVFSEIDLPGGLTGLDLACRARDLYPSTSILLTSARHLSIECDVPVRTTFFAKPYSRDAVCASITDAILQNARHDVKRHPSRM